MSQGGESNLNGRWLEQNIEWLMRERGVPIIDYLDDADNGNLFEPVRCVRRVPYTCLYECQATSEFVFISYDRRTRIECRTQEVSGSVDEKFPYLLRNAVERMPEREVLIVLHGNGARPGSVNWLKREAALIKSKSIQILDLTGFKAWLKDALKGK